MRKGKAWLHGAAAAAAVPILHPILQTALIGELADMRQGLIHRKSQRVGGQVGGEGAAQVVQIQHSVISRATRISIPTRWATCISRCAPADFCHPSSRTSASQSSKTCKSLRMH